MTPKDDDGLGELREDVATIKADMRWLKWLVFALVAAVLSPQIGGPDAHEAVALLSPP